VQRLVQAGASIDGGVEGQSTLWAAARAGTAQGVRMIPQLVALGARETRGNLAMIVFAQHSVKGAQPTDGEVVAALNTLVSAGCSLTQPDDGWTPLDVAACWGNAPVVRALLSLGAPATTSSLVHGAKHSSIVRILLAAGAPPNGLLSGAVARTPLMEAAHYAALESVQLLLAAGASVHRRGRFGLTALMSAIGSHDGVDVIRVVEALVVADVDTCAANNGGHTALHIVAESYDMPWAAAVAQLLVENGADASAMDKAGETPAEFIPRGQHDSELYRVLTEDAA